MCILLICFHNNREVILLAGNENLENIIAKIRGGQPEAFDELYRLTRNNVYYHAHRILANEEDALDAVQETYLVAFQRLGTLQNPSLAAAWLSGIATNVCLNKLRSDRHLSGLSLDDENTGIEPPAGEQDMPEAVIDQEAVAQIIAGMIDTLPALQRITILLFYYDELSVTAIAQLMDCPEATVRSRLSYARKSLELRIRSEEKRGVKLYSISPAAIALAFKSHAAQTLMPEAAASKIGLSLASGCGYRLTAAAHNRRRVGRDHRRHQQNDRDRSRLYDRRGRAHGGRCALLQQKGKSGGARRHGSRRGKGPGCPVQRAGPGRPVQRAGLGLLRHPQRHRRKGGDLPRRKSGIRARLRRSHRLRRRRQSGAVLFLCGRQK